MSRVRTFFLGLPRALSLLFGLALWGILCLLTFGQADYRKFFSSGAALDNLPLAGIGLALLLAGLWLYRRAAARRPGAALSHAGEGVARSRTGLLLAVYVGLFLLQCVMARSIWFFQSWDAGSVRLASAALARGEPIDVEYFRLCPNNAPLAALLALPYWAGMRLGFAEPYVTQVYMGALCVNLSGLFTTLCVCRLTKNKAVRGIAFGASTLWLLFSPYLAVPYTDSFSVLFPILAVYFLLSGLKAPARYGLAALAASLGAAIKPSSLIVLIAGLMLGAFKALGLLPWRRDMGRRVLITLLAVVLGYLPGRVFQDGATILLAGSPKPEEMLDMAHYLMIGTDDMYWGGHSVEGVSFSQSFPTVKERNAANLKAAWRHIADRSLGDNLHFFSVKAFKAYADGTFAWNASTLMDYKPRRTDALSLGLRSVFYPGGALNPAYCTMAQGGWLLALMLCAFGAIRLRKSYPVQLLSLTLLGLTGYQLLFEVWPRYLFLYAPLFLTLAILGLESLREAVRPRK